MKTNTPPNSPTKIIRLPEVMVRTGLSRSTVYNLIANSDFPKRISLSPRSMGFLEREVDAWIESRANQRAA